MDRRTFNKLMTSGVAGLGAVAISPVQAQQSATAGGAAPPSRWPDQVYRRLLVDTHIPDWDPLSSAASTPRTTSAQLPGQAFRA